MVFAPVDNIQCKSRIKGLEVHVLEIELDAFISASTITSGIYVQNDRILVVFTILDTAKRTIGEDGGCMFQYKYCIPSL